MKTQDNTTLRPAAAEVLRRWWRGEVRVLTILSGRRMERRTLCKLVLFWAATFLTGALLLARGLDGYSLVTAGAMWFSGAALLGDLARTRFTRDED